VIVIIPCGGKKRPGKWPAFQLYSGAYFLATLRAALRLAQRDRVFILSGKHGLLRLTDQVESYEQRIDEPGAVPVARVKEQARALGIASEPRVLILAGSSYSSVAKQVWPHAETPLLGMGIGFQMQYLSRLGMEA